MQEATAIVWTVAVHCPKCSALHVNAINGEIGIYQADLVGTIVTCWNCETQYKVLPNRA
ncbi:MAG: hypothetical protein WC822_01345 [Candidatus Paceibacterota bacterium]|jgi:RNase P subunit RPR2